MLTEVASLLMVIVSKLTAMVPVAKASRAVLAAIPGATNKTIVRIVASHFLVRLNFIVFPLLYIVRSQVL
jgi:hypothetical protein